MYPKDYDKILKIFFYFNNNTSRIIHDMFYSCLDYLDEGKTKVFYITCTC